MALLGIELHRVAGQLSRGGQQVRLFVQCLHRHDYVRGQQPVGLGCVRELRPGDGERDLDLVKTGHLTIDGA